MKKIIYIIIVIGFYGITSCNKNSQLTNEEIENLKHLREEEKLARDVYLFSYEKYGKSIFNNIAKSEQQHMYKVLNLLEEYNIEDPSSEDRGVFNNNNIQMLYNDLTAIADTSELGALVVGAMIEDVDIFDIDIFIEESDKNDIINVYEKLKCGSENHMRSFNNELNDLNYIYEPQYIDYTYFNSIISSSNSGCGNN